MASPFNLISGENFKQFDLKYDVSEREGRRRSIKIVGRVIYIQSLDYYLFINMIF